HRRVLEEALRAVTDASANASASASADADADAGADADARADADELRGAEIDLRLAIGRIDGLRGLHAAALPHFAAAMEIADAMGDRSRAGWSAAFLCFSLRPLGRFEEARAHGGRALAAARAARDPRLEAMAEQALGSVDLAAGDPSSALASYRRAVAAARIAGAPRLEGITLANVALAHRALGDLDEALIFDTESRAAFERAADRFHLARISVAFGNILVDSGKLDEAEAHLAGALDAVVEQGDLEGEIEARTGLARTAAARGDARLAQRRLDDLEAVARLTDDVVERRRVAQLRASLAPVASPPASPAAAPSLALRASRDGRTLELGDRRIDLSRRGPLRRLLIALVDRRLRDPGSALTVGDMLAAGWPGEKMRSESGAARVYMAIRRLRVLGLEPVLHTSDEGYALDSDVTVSWLDDPER
ncbi:MAG: serine/threonine-protein kinase transcriptional regulatory protein, partial [Myxococcaceae bacterium]|nr:serine/threonine-protein kinase transcriptional regulatory protein [Myxococcaceae bacterium]